MFQQLVQVAGRAGRSSNPGRVMIQTAHPDNPYLQLIRDHDFNQFFKYCTRERKAVRLPPFGHIALWRAESTNESAGLRFLEYVKTVSRNSLIEKRLQGVAVMDPVSSPMEKRAGRYRAQLLIKADSRRSLHELIPLALKEIEHSPKSRKVRWSIDIDPMDMF
jgi:primosomal protein N' (replication factor Y)